MEIEIVNLAVLSSQEQEKSCLRVTILKKKPGELFKVKAQLTKNSLRLKWRGIGGFGIEILIGQLCMELTVNMNHNSRSYIMLTGGLVKLRWKAAECSNN